MTHTTRYDVYDRLIALADTPRLSIEGFAPGFQALIMALLSSRNSQSSVWVPPDVRDFQSLVDNLAFWYDVLSAESTESPPDLALMPDYDRTPFFLLPTHPAIVQTRLHAWNTLAHTRRFLLVLPPSSLLRKMPSPDVFRRLSFIFEQGLEVPPDFARELLNEYGYRSRDLVQQPGEYAIRGAIIDLFPPGYAHPIRIELIDETIDDIRLFDVETQRSIQPLESFRLTPWLEFPVSRSAMDELLEHARTCLHPDRWLETWYEAVEEWTATGQFPGYEDFLPWFLRPLHPWTAILADARWFVSDPESCSRILTSRIHAFEEARKMALERGIPAPVPSSLIHTDIFSSLQNLNPGELLPADFKASTSPDVHAREAPLFEGDFERFARTLQQRMREHNLTLIVLRSRNRAERFHQLFLDHQLPPPAIVPPSSVLDALRSNTVIVTWGNLHDGFDWTDAGMLVLTEDSIFGRRPSLDHKHEVRLERFQAIDLSELKPGDLVVHRDHGIGRFIGLQRLQYGSQSVEAVAIEYQNGDKLYVPVDRLDTIHKYRGAGEQPPSLDRLGGKTWQAKKRRTRKAVEGIVKELVELYARRKVAQGYAFPPDDDLQEAFDSAVEFELTPDQERAVQEVKKDMMRPEPMDRLLCGDVGFGKTEVAMRAAFKAVNAGKQVAVLAPTTVLAFQHYRTFRQRFAEFPVRIAMLSRLVPPPRQKQILKDLKKGDLDIIIGTHRLLSKDVEFFDLGLVIIDEEQRFGVMQKERLKQMREHVDVLSMTATPIPRTLQMALTGIMNLSTIRTPPRDRLAVQTFIVHFSPEIITSAIEHELQRGGQVFVIHNEVHDLPEFAAYIQKLVPMARVVVAHGQMPARRLENVMLKFIQGEADVLVSTTIIENGIDIPNVNTLIVHNAHRFGLSQLYQLRGRVGRSHRRAYAYLMIPPAAELSETARKRLAALREFTELGAGFRLAALDLELRGAGELLGKRQHGHISTVGFDTYLEIIQQAVSEITKQPYRPRRSTAIQLPIYAEIPESYISSEKHRMYYYRQLAMVEHPDRVNEIADELRDLYGNPPAEVETLLTIARLRARAYQLGLEEIAVRNGHLYLQVDPSAEDCLDIWVEFLKQEPRARFEPPGSIKLPLTAVDPHPENLYRWLSSINP